MQVRKNNDEYCVSDFELLREMKVAYEYINNILDYFKINEGIEKIVALNDSKEKLSELYNYKYLEMENDIHNKGKLVTSACCKNCYNNLLISDIIDYSYQCTKCDENFYDFEVISDEVWYKEKGKVTKELPSSFNIQIVYDKNKELMHIGTDCSSGIKCKRKNTEELIGNIESYCNDFILDSEEKEREI